jgi:tetratricopeptide (TPR) repeat protein
LLAIWKDLFYKEIGGPVGLTANKVADLLGDESITDYQFEKLLVGLRATPAEVAIATFCHEGLLGLSQGAGLTPEEIAVREMELLEHARRRRARLTELARCSRAPRDGYPRPEEVAPTRAQACEQLARLRTIPRDHRVSAVQVGQDLQNWALCEATADESWKSASQDLKEARVWARVTREIAERVKGEEGWCQKLKGFANAHEPNVLRVEGELDAADEGLEPAKSLWLAGSDPDQILEPGRLLDFEGALRRDQRRFDEALSLFDRSRAVSQHPARPLVQKGFTYEVMGEYEPAIATLLEAEPYLDKEADPRLWYKQRSQMAVCYTHLGCYRKAAELIKEARPVAIELRDHIDLKRLTWLDARIAAGQGRRDEALSLLREVRGEFLAFEMPVDAALALLEESGLLLDEGQTAQVKALTPDLAKILKSKGVHREAQVALQFFQEAVERETATAELARRVLRFLFRARYDPGLRFES